MYSLLGISATNLLIFKTEPTGIHYQLAKCQKIFFPHYLDTPPMSCNWNSQNIPRGTYRICTSINAVVPYIKAEYTTEQLFPYFSCNQYYHFLYRKYNTKSRHFQQNIMYHHGIIDIYARLWYNNFTFICNWMAHSFIFATKCR